MKKHTQPTDAVIDALTKSLSCGMKPRWYVFRQPVEDFANEATPPPQSIFLPNAFKQDTDHWVQLSPFGDFGNCDAKKKPVIQRFQKADAETICNEFNSLTRKVTQPLGMPFYVGHPDHPRFKGQPGHTDTAAKGRGKEMVVRHQDGCPKCAAFANAASHADEPAAPCPDHGLFVKMHWSPDGEQLIGNESFHGHSVNWSAIPAGMEKGMQIFRPIRVKSAGFTNEPQIPVTPASLANEQQEENELANEKAIIPPKLKLIAGFKADEEVTMEQIIAALEKAHPIANEASEALAVEFETLLLANAEAMTGTADEKSTFIASLHDLLGTDPASGIEGIKTAINDKVAKAGTIDKVKKARAGLDAAYKKHSDARQELEQQIANEKLCREKSEAAFANERKLRATVIVDGLVASGKIITADKAARIEELCNAGDDFDKKAAEFGNSSAVVKTKPKTGELAGKHAVLIDGERQRTAKFEELMEKRRVEFPNEEYFNRFEFVGNSPEGAQLLTQMQTPDGDKKD